MHTFHLSAPDSASPSPSPARGVPPPLPLDRREPDSGLAMRRCDCSASAVVEPVGMGVRSPDDGGLNSSSLDGGVSGAAATGDGADADADADAEGPAGAVVTASCDAVVDGLVSAFWRASCCSAAMCGALVGGSDIRGATGGASAVNTPRDDPSAMDFTPMRAEKGLTNVALGVASAAAAAAEEEEDVIGRVAPNGSDPSSSSESVSLSLARENRPRTPLAAMSPLCNRAGMGGGARRSEDHRGTTAAGTTEQ